MASSAPPPAAEKAPQEKTNVGGGGVGAGKHKSKAYNTALAIRSDAAKYRAKYKDLKKQVLTVEAENDRMHATTLKLKRNIQRMRLERAMLYEKLEEEVLAMEQLGAEPEDAAPNQHRHHSEKRGDHQASRSRRRSPPTRQAYSASVASDAEEPRRREPSSRPPRDGADYSSPEPTSELEQLLDQAQASVRDYSSSEEESS